MQINFKWGIYAAIVALVLAFTTSLFLGQASFQAAILRAFLFGALFFALGTGVWTLINTFIPELLFPENENATANIFGTESPGLQGSDSDSYGSRINITLGDRSDAALPEGDGADSDEVGNIADLVSGAIDPAGDAKRQRGIDETNENSYTGFGESVAPSSDGLAEPVYAEETGGFTMNFDSFAADGGGGGADPFGDAFSVPGDSGGQREEALPERKVTGNKPMALEGDFNPKDIALGIRTVLETDKKG
jgi:hypothetical protein